MRGAAEHERVAQPVGRVDHEAQIFHQNMQRALGRRERALDHARAAVREDPAVAGAMADDLKQQLLVEPQPRAECQRLGRDRVMNATISWLIILTAWPSPALLPTW